MPHSSVTTAVVSTYSVNTRQYQQCVALLVEWLGLLFDQPFNGNKYDTKCDQTRQVSHKTVTGLLGDYAFIFDAQVRKLLFIVTVVQFNT